MADVQYDEEAARREVEVYRTDAAARRRALVRDRLDLDGDDTVVSVGCGPGFEPAELAETIGSDGRVLALDESPAMLDLARERCAGSDVTSAETDVTIARADAERLPLAADAVDALTAVQLLQYVPDPSAAVAAFARVLRSGGRAVVLDTDWRTLVWRADDGARSRAVIDAWIDQSPNPRIGSAVGPLLREAGFAVESVEPFTVAQRTLEDSFVGRLVPFFVDCAADHDAVGPAVAEAWAEDVRARDERGETFVSFVQYCYVASAP